MFGLFGKKKNAVDWRKSKSGNLTATDCDWRVTVYKAKNPKGFGYVLSSGDGDKEETFFSRRFKTEDEAVLSAETVFRAATSGDRNCLEATHRKYCDD